MKLFQRFFYKRFERTRHSSRSAHRSFENLEPRLAFDVDLSVSITNGQNSYVPGSDKVDTVIVQNLGRFVIVIGRDHSENTWCRHMIMAGRHRK